MWHYLCRSAGQCTHAVWCWPKLGNFEYLNSVCILVKAVKIGT